MELGLFALALLSPLFYAATNHFDNILLSKYFKEGGVGTLMLVSASLSVLALPVLYWIEPEVFVVSGVSLLVLVVVGCLNTLLLWCYLQAIFNDEPTVVIIYYQLVPVIGLVLGYFVLGELPSQIQMVAGLIIIVGAAVLTVALDADGVISFRHGRTAILMLVASTCWAAESTLFKLVALEENVWRSLFWEHVALVVLGAAIFAFVPHYRHSFLAALKVNSKPIVGLNVLNETLYVLGNSVAAYVVILTPVAVTLLMNSFQPLFVLGLGVLLTVLFPWLDVEHVSRRNLVQKAIAIALTMFGGYLLGW